jgi:hypothetical protein
MSTTRIVIVALALILLTAGPAAANDPPGPQTVLAEILILPLMMLLSLAGGAYAILEVLSPRKKKRWGAIGRWGGTILVILFSFAHEGFGFMVAVIFAIVAVRRGVQMLWWGMRARPAGPRLAHLQTANPWRLIPAGLSLVVLSLFLGSLPIAFFGYYPWDSSGTESLKKYVTYQLALGRLEQARTGQAKFRRIEEQALQTTGCGDRLRGGTRVEYDPSETGFTVLMLPKARFPFFPYNHLTSQPTYRADEAGKIRMISVHHQDAVCPPDAPVVMQVTEQDIQEMLKRLDSHGNCR